MMSCHRFSALLSGLILLLPVVACHPPPPSGATVVVLVDLSGSVRRPEMVQLYERSFDAVAQQLAPGDALLVAPVTAASEMTLDLPIRKEFPVSNPPNDNQRLAKRLRQQAATEARKLLPDLQNRFRSWLEKPHQKILHTDLFGSLNLAERLFASYPERPFKVLVIFSDMVQDSPSCNFAHEHLSDQRCQALVKTLRSSRQLPDLGHVQVHVVGAAADNSARFHSIRNFWLAYFKAVGATLRPEDYGSAMVRFRIARGGGAK